MSPEQINRDKDIDGRTDVYSLGAVLYEILTGQNSSVGESMDELVRSTLEDQPIPPSKVSPQPVTSRLEEICLRCLQKDPAARPQSVGEFIRELNEEWRES
jgi:serine/threonine protein kinase